MCLVGGSDVETEGRLSRCSDVASFVACGGIKNPISGLFCPANEFRASPAGGFGYLLGGELVFSATSVVERLCSTFLFLLGRLMRLIVAILSSVSVE